MKAETILMDLVLTGIKLVQEEERFLQSLNPDVCEIERKHITRKKELTHLPISYIQGYLVKRSYNVFLQETAFVSLFSNTAAHLAFHQHRQKHQVRENKSFFSSCMCRGASLACSPHTTLPSTLSCAQKTD